MTLGEILNRAQKEFEDAGIETARLDAEALLAHAAGKDRAWLCAERSSDADEMILKHFENFVARRKERCPVAYITGEKEFWSIPIKVTQDVLIPRPETELIVEQTIKLSSYGAIKLSNCQILDLCCGSGCIAAALAHEMPKANFTLADRSASAIEVAKENLAFASGRVKFLCGDMFEGIERSTPSSHSPCKETVSQRHCEERSDEAIQYKTLTSLDRHVGLRPPRDDKTRLRHSLKGEGIFDLIVSNPPYVPLTERGSLAGEIIRYEPQMALFGGKDGLDFIRRIIENAPRFLKTGGWLIIEIGVGQTDAVAKLIDKNVAYGNFSVHKDLAGIERVIIVNRKP